MCTNPIKIKNKGFKPYDPLSPKYLLVPCGHCEQCQQMRIAQLLFRADWQRQAVEKANGFTFFLTLTFNRENLNYCTYEGKNGKTYTCSTWNGRALTLFLKKYRKICSKNHLELSYLVTSERGKDGTYIYKGKTRKKTRRPHYHLILWHKPLISDFADKTFQSTIKDYLFRTLPICWSNYVRSNGSAPSNEVVDLSSCENPNTRFVASLEPIGIIYNEEVQRGDANATKYVVKYCVKDSADNICYINEDGIKDSTFPIDYKQMLPKTYQSNNIGMMFLDSYSTPSELLLHRSTLSDGSTSLVPRYYIQKLSRTIDILDVRKVHDDTISYLNGTHTLKFSSSSPFVDEDGVIHGERVSIHSQSNITDWGREFLTLSHSLACQQLYQEVVGFVSNGGYPFMFQPKQSWYPNFGKDVLRIVVPLLLNIEQVVKDITALSALNYADFCTLYDIVYHGFDSALLNTLDPSQVAALDAFNAFVMLRYFNNTLNKAYTDYVNKLKYDQNKIKAAQTMPYLFNNEKDAD